MTEHLSTTLRGPGLALAGRLKLDHPPPMWPLARGDNGHPASVIVPHA